MDIKVPWLSLEQFLSQGSPLSKAQSALKLPAWAEICKRCRSRLCPAGSQQWVTNWEFCPSSFSAVKEKSSSLWGILLLLGCATGLQIHSAGCCRSTLTLGCGHKRAPAVCSGESPHSLLLDFKEVSLLPPESMGFCGHSLEGHPNKGKSSFYSAWLDRVGFLPWDTGVGASMWGTGGALQCNKPSAGPLILWFAFFRAVNH